MKKRIILGSASPRRRELLEQIGVEFEVWTSDKEEVYHSTDPADVVCELAFMKAEHVAEELLEKEGGAVREDTAVIGADTVVVLDGRILGKPSDPEDAVRMLKSLQGRSHTVYTGVAVLVFDKDGEEQKNIHAEETRVFVSPMTEKEIRRYVDTNDSFDKAGAYGIQGCFASWIWRIEGDYYNVVGLPVSRVYRMLKDMDVV